VIPYGSGPARPDSYIRALGRACARGGEHARHIGALASIAHGALNEFGRYLHQERQQTPQPGARHADAVTWVRGARARLATEQERHVQALASLSDRPGVPDPEQRIAELAEAVRSAVEGAEEHVREHVDDVIREHLDAWQHGLSPYSREYGGLCRIPAVRTAVAR